MGMSASQLRLGSLTARMHDIEYKAQHVEAQKLQLALDKDSIYQTYIDALDKTKIQVAFRGDDGSFKYKDANFESVCTYQEGRARQYAVQDSSTNMVYLNHDQADLYELSKKARLVQPIIDAENTIAEQKTIYAENKSNNAIQDSLIATYSQDSINYAQELADAKGAKTTAQSNMQAAEDAIAAAEAEKESAINAYKTMYGADADDNYEDIYAEYMEAASQWSTEEVNYYDHLFELVDENNYKVLDNQYTTGDDGYTWFNNMVEAGLVTINEYVPTGSSVGWATTSVTTSVNNNYLQEVDDDTYEKKAEAEYEYALELINAKDKKYDNELTELETEEKSLSEEIESLEKVRDDNIESKFNLFS